MEVLLNDKRNLIFSIVSSVYKFSREFPNGLRFKIFGNLKTKEKISKFGRDTG